MNTKNIVPDSVVNMAKQINSIKINIPDVKKIRYTVPKVRIPTAMIAQIHRMQSIAQYLEPIKRILAVINDTTQQILANQINHCKQTGWLIFDIANDEVVKEYFDIQKRKGHDDEEFDINKLGLWIVKKRKLKDITEKIKELDLVNGTEHLPKMVEMLEHDDQSYKVLFQYVFSLIDSTFLYQRKRYNNSIKGLHKYNDSQTVKNYYRAVELNTSMLAETKFIAGQKNTAIIGVYDTLYNAKTYNFRNELMHGSIKYDELTEVKFYQLLALLYQLTVNDEVYQFVNE